VLGSLFSSAKALGFLKPSREKICVSREHRIPSSPFNFTQIHSSLTMQTRSGKVLPVPRKYYKTPTCFKTTWPSLNEAREHAISVSHPNFDDFVAYGQRIIFLCEHADDAYKKRLYALAIAASIFKLDVDYYQRFHSLVDAMISKLHEACKGEPDMLKYIRKLASAW
jgi:hypothetical protein